MVSWTVTCVNAFTSAGVTTAEYDAQLISWLANNPQIGAVVDYGTSKYTAATERWALINDYGWTITDSGGDGIHVDVSNAGVEDGTAANPYNTIQEAHNNAVAGQTIFVKPGTYPEAVDITTSGSAGNKIKYVCDGELHTAILEGGVSLDHGFHISGASYIIVEGFKAQNYTTRGVYIQGPSVSNVDIIKNWTYDTGDSGIACWGTRYSIDPAAQSWLGATDILISGNIVERAANTGIGAGFNEHITVANGVKDVEITENWVRNSLNSDPAYQHGAGGEGIDCKEGVENATIHRNTISNISKYGIYLDGGRSDIPSGNYSEAGFLKNILVYNNLVYNNGNHGIGVVSEGNITNSAQGTGVNAGRFGGWIDGIFIYNNTVHNCDGCGILLYDYDLLSNGYTVSTVPLADNVQVYNNILWDNNNDNNGGYSGFSLAHEWITGVDIVNNIANGNSDGIRFNTGLSVDSEIGNSISDPLFTNTGTADYTLQAGSPAINGANVTYVPVEDIDGNPRPFGGSGYDIGAYERQA